MSAAEPFLRIFLCIFLKHIRFALLPCVDANAAVSCLFFFLRSSQALFSYFLASRPAKQSKQASKAWFLKGPRREEYLIFSVVYASFFVIIIICIRDISCENLDLQLFFSFSSPFSLVDAKAGQKQSKGAREDRDVHTLNYCGMWISSFMVF